MTTDHTEFIRKHHKTAINTASPKAAKPNPSVILAMLSAALYFGFLLFLAAVVQMDDLTLIYIAITVLIAVLLGLITYRSYSLHLKQEQQLDIIQEVLEGSRGARLITDNADQTVYSNKKFDSLCKGVGQPGFQSLIKLFEHNDEALAHFRNLADKAHRGLTNTIDLFSRLEDRENWYSVTAQPVAGWAGYIHWRIDDVTDKFITDRAIREEREKLIDFTDNAPVGFFSVDESGYFVYANATFARWLGMDINTLLNNTTLHACMAEPPEKARPFDLVDHGGARQVAELRLKGPGGRIFLASITQIVVHDNKDGRVRTRAVVNDLTAQSEMRQALKASEARFQRFFEEAPLGIIQIDQDGIIQDCNNQFSTMLGHPVQDIEEKHFKDFIISEKKAGILKTIENISSGKEQLAPMEVTLAYNKDSVPVDTQMHARRFRDSKNIVLHFLDLREQKQLEAQFVQSQKMQAIGQLAGGVAHDFNNLLTAMIGFCDLLLLRHKPGDPSFSDIMQIKQNSNRAANLVRQLLAFSRQQTLRPKVQDITDILTELSHLIRRLIGAQIELDISHGSDLALVKVDEGQMEQVLINLAVNARDAMEGKGRLDISTENYTNRKPRDLATETLPPGHWVAIHVRDTGCGIPKKNIARIFEPFFTTKEVGHGTGLGLATVYGIIRQTDGYLDVTSKTGKGTTFSIYLPKVIDIEEEEEESDSGARDTNQDLTGTERLLLVEDEDAVRTFSQRALANKGYDVLAAESGEAALNLMNEQDNPRVDLLITDVVMPGMDGPTLAQRMRQNSPNLKIIFISGYTEDRLKDHMGDNIFFLPKPFTLQQLAEKVRDVLGS